MTLSAYAGLPNFRPMTPRRALALSSRPQPAAAPKKPAPAKTIVKPFAAEVAADQPEVSNNTGSAGLVASRATTPTEARAVASKPTPKPSPKKSVSVPGDDELLARVKAMSAEEFIGFIGFLMRVRTW